MAITDRRVMAPDPIRQAQRLIEELGPRLLLQIREKDLEPSESIDWIRRLAPAAAANGSCLLINGRLDIALSTNVGVHLPESGLGVRAAATLLCAHPHHPRDPQHGGRANSRTMPLSVARHTAEDAHRAALEGADIVLLSPIFTTPGKGEPLGLDELRRAVELGRSASTRLFALGGITPANAASVWATGVEGVAAIRSVWEGNAARLLDPRPS